MSLPTTIASEIEGLQAQTAAASPLSSASRATITAIKLNSAQLVADIETAITASAGQLDTFVAPSDPAAIVSGVLALGASAESQSELVNARGYVGRANANIDQLP